MTRVWVAASQKKVFLIRTDFDKNTLYVVLYFMFRNKNLLLLAQLKEQDISEDRLVCV
jgi:hypothetical protein